LTKDEKTIFIKIKENPKRLKKELASIIGKSEKNCKKMFEFFDRKEIHFKN